LHIASASHPGGNRLIQKKRTAAAAAKEKINRAAEAENSIRVSPDRGIPCFPAQGWHTPAELSDGAA